jgi:two-component system, sensor histidine kinase and response regulator
MSDKSSEITNSALSILVVDDDELNQRMMRLILKREGHFIECVSNGLEALNAIKVKTFDMILMDLQMPVMDGVEASRKIREWEKDGTHTFIVALTASYLPEKGRELFEAGIDNYISKPFEIEHLRHILMYGLENRKAAAEVSSIERASSVQALPFRQDFDHQIGIQRVGGDQETYKELLSDFIQQLPQKMEGMWACFRRNDLAGLGIAAHNLRGVSANLGALQLSEHAYRLEKRASESYTESIETVLSEISTISEKVRESAFNFLAAGI